ncbi:uracil-DNA glycosylase family protein [Streptomyces sp. INA 01156]
MSSVGELDAAVATCRACPRPVAWREEADRVNAGRFGTGSTGQTGARLRPAGRGAGRRRLGPGRARRQPHRRIFTGDPSGDAPYAALYDLDLASRPTATHRGDGLELYGVRITVPVHCAPPGNRPTTGERDTRRPWLAREPDLLRPTLRALVVLGGFARQALLPVADAGRQPPRPRPAFGHGAEVLLTDANSEQHVHLVGGYHPAGATSTRTLTPPCSATYCTGRRHRRASTGTAVPAVPRAILMGAWSAFRDQSGTERQRDAELHTAKLTASAPGTAGSSR